MRVEGPPHVPQSSSSTPPSIGTLPSPSPRWREDSDQGILYMAVLKQLGAPAEHLLAHLPELVMQDPLGQGAAEDQLPPRAKPVEGDGGDVVLLDPSRRRVTKGSCPPWQSPSSLPL